MSKKTGIGIYRKLGKWKLQNNFTEEAGGKYMEEAWTQGWHN